MEDNNSHKADPIDKHAPRYRLVIKVVMAMLLVGFVLLQLPPVQTFLARKVAGMVSDKIEAQTSIEKATLSLRRGVVMSQFLLREIEGDTIVYADNFSIGLGSSLITLLSNKLVLDDISLSGGRATIRKRSGQTQTNLALMLSRLSGSPSTQNTGSPLDLRLKRVKLNDFVYETIDENTSVQQHFAIAKGNLVFEKLDIPNLDIIIESFFMDRPIIRIDKGILSNEYIVKDVDLINQSTAPNPNVENQDSLTARPLMLLVRSLEICNGLFSFQDQNKPVKEGMSLDYAHMMLDDIQLQVSDFMYQDGSPIQLNLDGFGFVDDKGFELGNSRGQVIIIGDKGIHLPSFSLITEDSHIGQDIRLKYRSWKDLNDPTNRVIVEANLEGTQIAISDLAHFIPGMEDNKFVKQNINRKVTIAGRLFGKPNSINGKDILLKIDDDLVLSGNVNTRSLNDSDETLINLGLKRLETDVRFLKTLIPGFSPPDNFYKLGKLRFKGRFDGYYKDFVAFGQLETNLGKAKMDMRLDVKDGVEKANYSGELALIGFDVARWSDNANLGMVTASSKVSNGQGLIPETAQADLNARVDVFDFKGFRYENFVVDGSFAEYAFDGLFSIQQPEVNFEFDGKASLQDGKAVLNFQSDVRQIDLKALNLTKTPFAFKGKLNLNTTGNTIHTFDGKILASDLQITKADSLYFFDTINIASNLQGEDRSLRLYSDVVDAELTGKYRIDKVVDAVKRVLKKTHPFHTQSWTYDPLLDTLVQDFAFKLAFHDTKNLLELAGVPQLQIQGLTAKGKLQNITNTFDLDAIVGSVQYKDTHVAGGHVNLSNQDEFGYIVVGVDSVWAAGRAFNPIQLESQVNGDTIAFQLNTNQLADSLEKINIIGQLEPHPKGYRLNIDENEWVMLGTSWDFDNRNEIVFGKNYLSIERFNVTDGYRTIGIKDINRKGVLLELNRFDFLLINGLINYDKIDFSGEGDLYVSVENLFVNEKQGMVNMSIPDFRLNDQPYGSLELTALKGNGSDIRTNVAILKDTMAIVVNGQYDLEHKQVSAEARLDHVPLTIFEMIIPKGISNVAGTASAAGLLTGPVDNLTLDGGGNIYNGQIRIDYLGNLFTIGNQPVKVTQNVIDATGVILRDLEGNPAVISGGLEHDMFRDITQNLVIEADNAIIINTTRSENPYYFGRGKGRVRAQFSGSFSATDLRIDAEAGAGTRLNIPVQSLAEGYDESFIKFVDRKSLQKEDSTTIIEPLKIEGLEVTMDLTLNENADVRIIFDEQLGDVIEGRGNGDLQIKALRSRDFEIYGDYEISSGEYLFTAFGIVAKAFKIERGGLIRWTGDPVNATLDIDGTYEVDAPIETFITEYLFDDQLRALARNKTLVALQMELRGRLYEPVINFDLEFPELTGELKAYADNKIRTLRDNAIALNSQVVGLLAFQTFLPDNNLAGNDVFSSGSFFQSAGVSTLSEFVSSQLSRLFTGLFESALANNGLIAGVDFDIGLVKNTNLFQQNNTGLAPDEVEINLKNRFRFLDERLSLNLGGNYVRQNTFSNGTFFGVDFALEYFITNDRKLKLRVYGRNDVDQFIENGRQQQYGLGIGYRTEFGTLADFQEGISRTLKEVIKEEN